MSFSCILGICESPYVWIAGGCFQFLDLPASWDNARSVCQSSLGDLAIVNDCSLMTELINYINAAGGFLLSISLNLLKHFQCSESLDELLRLKRHMH